MKLLAFVPIKLTLLLIIGILIGYYFPFHINWSLAILLTFFIISGILFYKKEQHNSVLFGIAVTLTTISLGVFISINNQPNQHDSHYSHKDMNGLVLWNLKIIDVLKPTNFSNRYIAKVQYVNNSSATGKILFSTPTDSTKSLLEVDNELTIYAKLATINPALNPHQFDYKRYMKQQGVFHQIRSKTNTYVLHTSPSRTLKGYAAKARNYMITQLEEKNFGKEELGVIQALLLGERSYITDETYTDYKNAGAVHILAVSGLHIGILLLLIQFILKPLSNLPSGKTIVLVLSVLLLWGYAFLAGLSPSVIRACAMFSFVAYALYLNRPSNHFNILALSMFFVLLFINPNLLFHVGFQMSYSAVFSIVWIYPQFQKLWSPKAKISRYFWQLLSVSIAAQLGVLPISLFYFHQFPGLFFVSNLLIIPFLGLILVAGILVIILSLLQVIPDWLISFYNTLITYMNLVVEWVSEQEHFVFKSISFDGVQLVLTYLFIIAAILTTYRISFKRVVFFLASLLCFQVWTLSQEIVTSKKTEVLIPHQTRNTIVINRYGDTMDLLTTHKNKTAYVIDDYMVGERVGIIRQETLKNSYHYLDQHITIIDSLGIYNNDNMGTTVVLTGSPKINLDRLITNTRPDQIIADGSNFKSFIERWKLSCVKNKIPFHYTGEKGAYYFK